MSEQTPFADGWLDRQVQRSIDLLASLPPGLRRSMGLTDYTPPAERGRASDDASCQTLPIDTTP